MANLQNIIINDTGFLKLPNGTTAQRPATPVNGMSRFNTDLSCNEVYYNNTWIDPTTGAAAAIKSGLILNLDAGIYKSYPGSGILWSDLSGNKNSGIFVNNPTYNSNNSGSIVFDGINSYVNVPYNSSLNTPNGCTYEVWVYPISAGEILSRGKSDSGTDPDNPRLYVYSNGNIYWDWSVQGTDKYMYSSSNCTMNAWNHVLCTAVPNDQLYIYINSVDVSGTRNGGSVPATITNSDDPIIIGGVGWIPRYFAGRLGVLRVYNKALSSTEIQQNFNALRERYEI